MAEVGGILSKYVDKPDALADVRAMLKPGRYGKKVWKRSTMETLYGKVEKRIH